MFKIQQEKGIEQYPFQISIKDTLYIIEQFNKSVCQIITEKTKGTAFICKFFNFYDNKEMKILITNNHIVGSEELKQNSIKFSYYDGIIRSLELNNSRRAFTDKKLDITIIELKEKDRINNCLEFDENFIQNKEQDLNSFYRKKSIYTLFYSKDNSYISYGIIKTIGENHIIHSCSTEHGASGSPVCLLGSKKVIGIHVGGLNYEANTSVSFRTGLNEFLNSLNKNKIEQESICYFEKVPISPKKNYHNSNNNKNNLLDNSYISDNGEKSNKLKKEFKKHKIENEELENSQNIIFNNKRIFNNLYYNKVQHKKNNVTNNCSASKNINSKINNKNNIINQNNLGDNNMNLNNKFINKKNNFPNNYSSSKNINTKFNNNKNNITNQNNFPNNNINLNNQFINKGNNITNNYNLSKNVNSKSNNNFATQNNFYNNNFQNQNNFANKFNYMNNNIKNNYLEKNNINLNNNNNTNRNIYQNNIKYILNNLNNNNYNKICNNPNIHHNKILYFVNNLNNGTPNYINNNAQYLYNC